MPYSNLKQTISFAFGSLIGDFISSYLNSYVWYKYDPVFPSPDQRFLLSLLITAFAVVIGSCIFFLGLILTKRLSRQHSPDRGYWKYSFALGLFSTFLPLLIPEFFPDIAHYAFVLVLPLLFAYLLRLIINFREASNQKNSVSSSSTL